MKKRLFSLLLALLMVFSLFPALSAPASAVDAYNVWVSGVQVTSANKNDILGDGGRARFNPSNNTLILNNPSITNVYDNGETVNFIYSSGINLTVVGQATISGKANGGISVYKGTLTVGADLNINITGSPNNFACSCLSGYYGLTVEEGNSVLRSASSCLTSAEGDVTVSGGSLTATSTSGKRSVIDTPNSVVIGNGVRNLDLTGNYGTIYSDAGSITIGDELSFVEPGETNVVLGKAAFQSDGVTRAKRIVLTHAYDLWVGGVRLTGANYNDMLSDGGSVRFDLDSYTLTLNNANITDYYTDAKGNTVNIYSKLDDVLTIAGSGTIGDGSTRWGVYANCADSQYLYGGSVALDGDFTIPNGIVFAVNAVNSVIVRGGHLTTGSLRAQRESILLEGGELTVNGILDTNSTCAVEIGSGMQYLEINGGSSKVIATGSLTIDDALAIAEPAGGYVEDNVIRNANGTNATHVVIVPGYDLWVGGVRVTALNQDDVLGDGTVRYYDDYQGLVLNNANITGAYTNAGGNSAAIYSLLDDLSIDGTGTVDGTGKTWAVYCGETADGGNGYLTLNGDLTFTGGSAYTVLSYGALTVTGGNITTGVLRSYNSSVRLVGGNVTATNGIQADVGIEIGNGIGRVEATGKSVALSAYADDIILGDQLIITEPEGAIVRNGRVYESDNSTAAKHVVIINGAAYNPVITAQPTDVSVKVGSAAKFTVEAQGEGLTYQWKVSADNGETWSNSTAATANSATLSFTAGSAYHGRLYRCVVTSAYGGVAISDAAKLTVKPRINSNPQAAKVAIGGTAKFSVKATGADLTYQWQYKTSPDGTWKKATASGATTATISVPATAGRNGYLYRCVVTDKYGQKATSYSAILVIKTVITKQPVSVSSEVGKTVKFSVEASGAKLTYQWQLKVPGGSWKDSTASGAKTATVSVPATAARNGYQYRCIITDANKLTTNTNAAKLTILTTITTQPKAASAAIGAKANFTVAATGAGLTYQWQYKTPSGTAWKDSTAAGAKTAKLSVTVTEGRNGYLYRCVITDANGKTVTSGSAKLTVKTAITAQPKSVTVTAGNKANFTVEATGVGLTYQWQYQTAPGAEWKDSSASGAKTASVSVTATAARNGYLYRCVIADANGKTTTTNAVTLTVK